MRRNLIIGATVAVAVIVAGFAAYRIKSSPTEALTEGQPTSSTPSDAGSAYNQEFLKSFIPATHDSCVKSAAANMAQHGADPANAGMDQRIEAYCSCTANNMATALSVPELQSLAFDNKSEPAATKMKAALQECMDKLRPPNGGN